MNLPKQIINNLIFYENQTNVKFWSSSDIFDLNMLGTPTYKGTLLKFQSKNDNYVPVELRLYRNRLYYIKDEKIKGYRNLGYEILIKSKKSESTQYPYSFSLAIGMKEKKFYANSKLVVDIWYQELKKYTLLLDIANEYELLAQVGKGNSSAVFKIKAKNSENYFAAKAVPIDRISQSKSIMKNFMREIDILRSLKHDSIIRLESIYLGAQKIYLVTELIEGGTLFDKIRKNKKFSEESAAIIIKSLLKILIYLEERGIVHRDIKLENVLLANKLDESEIKLIDFGLAAKLEDIDFSHSCGTPGCVAPEMFSFQPYDFKVDVFSAGIMLYTMLSATIPFHSEDVNQVVAKNYECEIKFPDKYWENISKEAVYLIKKMTEKNPKYRYKARDCLKSAWIKMHTINTDEKDETLDSFLSISNSQSTTASTIPTLDSKFFNSKKSIPTMTLSDMRNIAGESILEIQEKQTITNLDSVSTLKCYSLTKSNNPEEKIDEYCHQGSYEASNVLFLQNGRYIMTPKCMPQRQNHFTNNEYHIFGSV